MSFGMPWALFLLAIILFFWRENAKSLVTAPSSRRRNSCIVRSIIFGLLVIALSDPRINLPGKQIHVLWLVDVSRSVYGEAAKKASDLHTSNHPGDESWIAFGAKGTAAENLRKLADIPAESETDLAGALKLAEASFPPGKVRTLALVTDGVETSGNAAALAEDLRKQGIKVHTFSAAPPDKPEVLVASVEAPRQIRANEPFRVSVNVSSNRETDAEIDVFRNGVKVGARQERLKVGETKLEFTQTLKGDERMAEFSAEVRTKEDSIADNNRASTVVETEGVSKVLLISDKPDQSRYLSWALKQEGILLDPRPAVGAPTTLADLQNYDLVILDNVPATALTQAQMELLRTYVRDFGGGFLMTGGDQAYGLGGYYRTPIEDILPVRCDFEKDKETPSLGIVFVIDRSGSMSGEKIEMAKEAAKASLELLSDRDYTGVVAFDNEAFWAADMQSAAERGGIAQKISSIQEGGGTNLAPGMELALQALRSSPAKIKHAILLTDGVSTPGPFYELATQMAAEKITVSTVAVGDDADAQLLQQIATWGNGRFYLALDPRTVPQIFAKETMAASKSAIQEAPFLPIPVKPADFLGGVTFDSAPFLLGYVTTKPKPTAEVWLATEKSEPLLATWRYGLGQAGAWTSDARNRWAVEWLRWDGFGKFWAQIVRKLARPEAVRKFPATIEREGQEFVLKADTVDAMGGFLNNMEGSLTLSTPDGRTLTEPMRETAPGHFEARWRANKPGAYHAQFAFKKDGQMIEQQALSATTGYPPEFLPKPANEQLLRNLAQTTGGWFNPSPNELWKDNRSTSSEAPLWPWLALLALLLFVGDVALKRWPKPARSASEKASRKPEPVLRP